MVWSWATLPQSRPVRDSRFSMWERPVRMWIGSTLVAKGSHLRLAGFFEECSSLLLPQPVPMQMQRRLRLLRPPPAPTPTESLEQGHLQGMWESAPLSRESAPLCRERATPLCSWRQKSATRFLAGFWSSRQNGMSCRRRCPCSRLSVMLQIQRRPEPRSNSRPGEAPSKWSSRQKETRYKTNSATLRLSCNRWSCGLPRTCSSSLASSPM